MRDYTNAVANGLREMGYEVEVKDIDKANGIVRTGIVVRRPGDNVGATIYVNDMYEDGVSVEDALKMVKEIVDKSLNVKPFSNVIDDIKNYDKIKGKLTVRLYNESTKVEVSRSAKKYGFDDLIIVPVINLESEETGKGSIKVNKSMLTEWGVDRKTLFDDALANTKDGIKAESMLETLAKMQGISLEQAEELYGTNNKMEEVVVTNRDNMFGAASILGLLPEYKKKFEKGFYVLPSSVHEVLVVPNDDLVRKDALDEMVRSVNATCVAPEEILGNKAYAFV